jgi:hypothetical protein
MVTPNRVGGRRWCWGRGGARSGRVAKQLDAQAKVPADLQRALTNVEHRRVADRRSNSNDLAYMKRLGPCFSHVA